VVVEAVAQAGAVDLETEEDSAVVEVALEAEEPVEIVDAEEVVVGLVAEVVVAVEVVDVAVADLVEVEEEASKEEKTSSSSHIDTMVFSSLEGKKMY